jgi:hypothetical protein
MNDLMNKPLALEKEHLSPYGSQWETMEGGYEIYKTRLWKWASLSIGAMLGNLEEGLFTSDSKRQI